MSKLGTQENDTVVTTRNKFEALSDDTENDEDETLQDKTNDDDNPYTQEKKKKNVW